jgi:hypothetical protein
MPPQSGPRPGARLGRQTENNGDIRGRNLDPLNYRSDDLTLSRPVGLYQLRLQMARQFRKTAHRRVDMYAPVFISGLCGDPLIEVG